MLQIIQPSTDGSKNTDWHKIWRNSPEFTEVKKELGRLNALPSNRPPSIDPATDGDKSQHQEFVASFSTQFWQVLIRTWKHFWRSPTYIWSKIVLIVLSVSIAAIALML
jgi:ATP-binding cassette, subfamily G (WHITE), member 2, PDR